MKPVFSRALFLLLAVTAWVHADGVANSTGTSVTVSTQPAAAVPGTIVLTLEQSIQLAMEQATAVLKAKNNVQATGTQLLQAYFEFLPSVDASASYAYARGREYFTQVSPTSVLTTNRAAAYDVVGDLNLFNGLADLANYRSGSNRHTASTFTLYRAKQQIAYDVTQAYLQVLLDRQIVMIGQVNLQSSREREQLLNAQTQVGARSLADFYRQEAQTASDELFLLQSRARERDDMILLLRRLRVDLLTPYDIAPIVFDSSTVNSYGAYNAENLVRQALRQRADLQAQERLADATRWDVTTARAGYFPRVDLVGDIGGTGSRLDRQLVDGVDNVPPDQASFGHQLGRQVLYTAGVNVTWGLFDRFLTRLAVARAEETAADTAIDAADVRLQVEGEVQSAMIDYQSAWLQIISAEKGARAAQESFDAVQARYQVGASSIVDLLTAQTALVQAQAAQAQANIGFTLETKTIDLALGSLPIH